jgi:hypothetical protein
VIAVLRRWWRNPQTALRLTLAVIISGGVIAGFGTFFRDIIAGQNDQWTFLLNTIGLLIAVFGAILDFRATSRVAEFAPGFGPGIADRGSSGGFRLHIAGLGRGPLGARGGPGTALGGVDRRIWACIRESALFRLVQWI